MRVQRRVVLASMVVAACAGREGPRAADSPAAARRRGARNTIDTVTTPRRREALRDMTGDGQPERFVVTADGPRYDSLTVRLEIRSPADSLLYSASWPSASYFKYEDRGQMSDADSARLVGEHLDQLLADTAFGVGPRIGQGLDGRPADDLDAIRYDIAEYRFRETKRLPPTAPLPEGWWDDVHVVASRIPDSRLRPLAHELRSQPSFRYYAGGEETYVIAWSQRERRFVRIFACC
jgi:hypothetical protein